MEPTHLGCYFSASYQGALRWLLTRIFHTSHEIPTGRSADMFSALGVRAAKAGCKPALRSRRYEISGLTKMWIENGLLRRPPPKPDRRFSRIRLSSLWLPMDWLRHSTPGLRRSRTSRVGTGPAHLFSRRSTVESASNSRSGSPGHPGAQPCGTTRFLLEWSSNAAHHHIPVPLRSTIIARFFATTRTLTPTGPLAAGRGSLIHAT